MEFEVQTQTLDVTEIQKKEQSRASIESALVIAKKFPRDIHRSYQSIIASCKRKRLAETAQYDYPRGGQTVSGISIRLAEVMAQQWGNLDFGVHELEQKDGESVVESYCWDLETNVKQSKVFTVKHERKARGGTTKLTDSRDIYELVASMGARRLRACILGIIPSDVADDAVAECESTLRNGGGEPIADRIKKLVTAFATLGVLQENLESRLKHKLEATTEQELVGMRKIYVSIKDGFTKREDWFSVFKTEKPSEQTAELNKKFGMPDIELTND